MKKLTVSLAVVLLVASQALAAGPPRIGDHTTVHTNGVPDSGNPPSGDDPAIPNCFIGFSAKYPGVKCETLGFEARGDNGLTVQSITCTKVASATFDCQRNLG